MLLHHVDRAASPVMGGCKEIPLAGEMKIN
jgi:hypothetical protein